MKIFTQEYSTCYQVVLSNQKAMAAETGRDGRNHPAWSRFTDAGPRQRLAESFTVAPVTAKAGSSVWPFSAAFLLSVAGVIFLPVFLSQWEELKDCPFVGSTTRPALRREEAAAWPSPCRCGALGGGWGLCLFPELGAVSGPEKARGQFGLHRPSVSTFLPGGRSAGGGCQSRHRPFIAVGVVGPAWEQPRLCPPTQARGQSAGGPCGGLRLGFPGSGGRTAEGGLAEARALGPSPEHGRAKRDFLFR